MNEVERGSARSVLFQKPENPFIERVGNFLEPPLGDGELIPEYGLCVVEKHAEHAAPVQDAIEVDHR